jgi:tetratricopeptide (TPR) repeat protein
LETDELAGALAGHYLSAYRNAGDGPDAAALGIQARIALKAAADRATALGANEQALHFLDMGLEIVSDPVDEADLREAAGRAAEFAAEPDKAIAHWGRAEELRAEAGDRVGTLRAITGRLRTMIVSFRSLEALPIFEATASEYGDLAGDPVHVRFEAQRARANMFAEDHPASVRIADGALEAAERMNLPDVVADAMITKGTSLMRLGRVREGLVLAKAGGSLAESLDLMSTAIRAYINSIFSEALDDPRGSLATTRAGIELARRIGMGVVGLYLVTNGSSIAVRTGEWDWAVRELEEMLDANLDAGHRADCLVALIELSNLRGLDDSALRSELDQLTTGIKDMNMEANLQESLALRAFVDGHLADGHRAYHRASRGDADVEALVPAARLSVLMGDLEEARLDLAAAEAASGTFGRAIQADFGTIRAGITALEGRHAEAVNGFRGVLRTWRDLGLTWDVALTGLVMAAVLDPSEPDVAEAIAISRQIFEELGARPFLRLLDEVSSRDPAARAPQHATPSASAEPVS